MFSKILEAVTGVFSGWRWVLGAAAFGMLAGFGSGVWLTDRLWRGHVAQKELAAANSVNEALTKDVEIGHDAAITDAAAEAHNDAVQVDTGGNRAVVIPLDVLRGLASLR